MCWCTVTLTLRKGRKGWRGWKDRGPWSRGSTALPRRSITGICHVQPIRASHVRATRINIRRHVPTDRASHVTGYVTCCQAWHTTSPG